MKKFLIAAALSAAFATAATAQSSDNTRDPAFGKRDMGPNTPSIDKPHSTPGGMTTGMASGRHGATTTKRSKRLDR